MIPSRLVSKADWLDSTHDRSNRAELKVRMLFMKLIQVPIIFE